jgi:Na+/phosphate symporter
MLLEERRSLVEVTTKKLKAYLQELYQDNLDQETIRQAEEMLDFAENNL